MASSARPQSVVDKGVDKYGLQGSYANLLDHEQRKAAIIDSGSTENAAVPAPPIPMTNKSASGPAGG